jgi:hypothetical protein
MNPISSSTPEPSGVNNTTPITTSTNSQIAGGESTTSSSTKIKTLEDLKKSSPKVYDMTMQALAASMIRESKRHQERLTKLIREGRET